MKLCAMDVELQGSHYIAQRCVHLLTAKKLKVLISVQRAMNFLVRI